MASLFKLQKSFAILVTQWELEGVQLTVLFLLYENENLHNKHILKPYSQE